MLCEWLTSASKARSAILKSPVLEICIDHIDSAIAARDGGADRLEICGPLSVGGTTPSAGLTQQCAELDGIETAVMIRPHAGSFRYTANDIQTMQRDIRFAKSVGADGVVFGLLNGDRRIDIDNTKRLIDLARPLKVTFHRAFDVAMDPLAALDDLIELNVDRLLTSGQADTALAGTELIKQLVQRANGEISIIAASGINEANVLELVQQTGVREIHASASVDTTPTDYPIHFGGRMLMTLKTKVREMRDVLQRTCE